MSYPATCTLLRILTLWDKLIAAFINTVLSVGTLPWELRDRVLELALNPCFVLEQGVGVRVVDALIVLRSR